MGLSSCLPLALLLLLAAVAAAGASENDCKDNLLLKPQCCVEAAPDKFQVVWTLTAKSSKPKSSSTVTLQVEREWAPIGVDRFYCLAKLGYFDSSAAANNNNAGLFRVISNFVAQFGIAGNTTVSAAWQNANLKDDPVLLSNVRGTIAYATAGPDTRTTQLFVNYGNNSRLDAMGFAPFGKFDDDSMAVWDAAYDGYGEAPDQDQIYAQGDAYLHANFPKLDYIVATKIVTL
eukprot:m.50297 g.50297  ORF g.50297 m.50297 type:complete len:232 (-) comp12890_c0_seq2:528-1223(-)